MHVNRVLHPMYGAQAHEYINEQLKESPKNRKISTFPRINAAAYILHSAEGAVLIQGWRLFEGGVYKSRYIS